VSELEKEEKERARKKRKEGDWGENPARLYKNTLYI